MKLLKQKYYIQQKIPVKSGIHSNLLISYFGYLGHLRNTNNARLDAFGKFYRNKRLVLDLNLFAISFRKIFFLLLKFFSKIFFKRKTSFVNFFMRKAFLKFLQRKLVRKKKRITNFIRKYKFVKRTKHKRKLLKKKKKELEIVKRTKLCFLCDKLDLISSHEDFFKEFGQILGLSLKTSWFCGFLTNRPRRVWKKKRVIYEKFPGMLVVVSSEKYMDVANEAKRVGIPSIGLITSTMEPVFTYNIVVGHLTAPFVDFFLRLIIKIIKLSYHFKFLLKQFRKFIRKDLTEKTKRNITLGLKKNSVKRYVNKPKVFFKKRR